jgi:hypothetical protein
MLSLQQVDKYFNLAQIILFLGIIGIFLGNIFNSSFLMNISLGVELIVGLLFLVPLLTAQIQTQIKLARTLIQQCKDDVNAANLKK